MLVNKQNLFVGGSCTSFCRSGNGTIKRFWMKRSGTHPYHVEVVIGEGEPHEKALSRFRKLVNQSGVIPEARRHMRFESNRDRKLRKLQEKFNRRKRKYIDDIETYEQTHGIIEPSPFQDLFSGDEQTDDTTANVNELIAMASGAKSQYVHPKQERYYHQHSLHKFNQQYNEEQNQWYTGGQPKHNTYVEDYPSMGQEESGWYTEQQPQELQLQ